MVAQKRYVKLNVGNDVLGVYYDYKHFFTSQCHESYSKYLCLSPIDSHIAYFTMEVSENETCSFQFYDRPYKGQWMAHDGGYLYVKSQYDYLGGVFGDNGNSVKLYTIKGGQKNWFKRGNKYKNDACGNYYYVVTTTNESEALTFSITDLSSGLLDPRDAADLQIQSRKAYFFQKDQYTQFAIAAGRTDEGYPKPIADNWPVLNNIGGGVDAIVEFDQNKVYVFKGSQYFCYDASITQIGSGDSQPISGNCLPVDKIDNRVKVIVEICTVGYSADDMPLEKKLKDMNFVWETYSLPQDLRQLFLSEEKLEEMSFNDEQLEDDSLLLTYEEVDELTKGIETVGDFINKAIAFYPKVLDRNGKG